jgi:hypothetical protein
MTFRAFGHLVFRKGVTVMDRIMSNRDIEFRVIGILNFE